jgi:RimJ/RimL family protein N-acetyltransferase
MLRSDRVLLRAREPADVELLHRGLQQDVVTRSRSDSRPWRPLPLDASPFTAPAADDERVAAFTIVSLESGDVIGAALLWAIDTHNRLAHLGLSLLPDYRGQGLSGEVVQLLCSYGFLTRGLHRLQLETLADNAAMIKTALSAGFSREATLRDAAWANGRFVDEAIFGLLCDEWLPG